MTAFELLDIRTIFILLPFTALLMILVLSLGPRSERREGMGRWIAGLAHVAAAWVLMASRGYVDPVLSVAAADALMVGGLCLQVGALYEFRHHRLPSRWLWLPMPVVFVAQWFLLDNFKGYSLVGSSAISVPLLALGVMAWRVGAGAVRWPMAAFFILGALLIQYRALAIWFTPDAALGFFHASPIHVITFVSSFAMTITGSFGFLEMHRLRAEENIRYYAMYDSLTDLLNRRAFLEMADRELSRVERANASFAILLMDLDRFKQVNDNFGHFAGDRVLQAVAETAKRHLRNADLVSRYGGEEFCAMLGEVDSRTAVNIAERIRAAVGSLHVSEVDTSLTISIGIDVSDEYGSSAIQSSIRRADAALYEAKRGGRNRVVLARDAKAGCVENGDRAGG